MPWSFHWSWRRSVASASIAIAALAVATDAALNAGASLEPRDDKMLAHLLDRITFGVRPGDLDKLEQIGVATYIDRQLQPARLDDSALEARLQDFDTLSLTTREIAEEYSLPAQRARRERKREQTAQSRDTRADTQNPQIDRSGPRAPEMMKQRQVMIELNEQKLLRAIYSERQLQEVLVDFWFNHFNVFAGKGPDRFMLTSYERDVIRPNVFGKFRDLLGATAHSPAMLFYLDNWLSVDPAAAQQMTDTRDRAARRRPRQFGFTGPQFQQIPNPQAPPAKTSRRTGLNENYARELMELHTLGVDGGYTQHDIVDVARALTGWTIADPRRDGAGFQFEARLHDNGAKVVLGHRIDAGGQKDGEQVLDILAHHPSTARFISTKLARRFVSDDPPQALIDRAARRFQETDGDLREVVRTILTSPEFYDPSAYRVKVKNPLEFVVSALRATNADVRRAAFLSRSLQELGMPLYMSQPPTGYADRADAWVNTGALVNRMNFAVSLANNKIPGVRVDFCRLTGQNGSAPGGERVTRAAGLTAHGSGRLRASGATASLADQPPPRLRRSAEASAKAEARSAEAGAPRPHPEPRVYAHGRGPQRGSRAGVPAEGLTAHGGGAPCALKKDARDRLVQALLRNDASTATVSTLRKATDVSQLAALTIGAPEFQRR